MFLTAGRVGCKFTLRSGSSRRVSTISTETVKLVMSVAQSSG